MSSATTSASPAVPSVSPDEAMERLLAGNARYLSGNLIKRDDAAIRKQLVSEQHPFAAILSCSDSRFAPVEIFDTGIGDLFDIRVAGNVADTDGIASIEYTVTMCGTRLIVVLGHTHCGGVAAAVAAHNGAKEAPGHIPDLIHRIRPAVEIAAGRPGDLSDTAIEENVRLSMRKITASEPILSTGIRSGWLRVVGMVYDLAAGTIRILPD